MATPLKDKLRAQAIATPQLTAILGTNPFSWHDVQLPQNAVLPAVVVQQISGPKIYSYSSRLKTAFKRLQFTIWGGQFDAGSHARDNLAVALAGFLDGVNFDGIQRTQQNPNFIVGDRDALFPQTDGPIYLRIIDAMIYEDETL